MRRLLPVLPVLLLWACAPPPPPAVTEAPPPPVTPAAPPVAPPAPRSFDESLLRGKEFLLEVPSATVPEIRDPVLGPVGHDGALTSAVDRFFRGVAQGTFDPAVVQPRWAAYLRAWAKKTKEAGLGPGQLRLGQPLSSADEIMVGYRWVEPQREQSGWVVVVRDGDSYRISDVQTSGMGPRTGAIDPEAPQEISSPSLR